MMENGRKNKKSKQSLMTSIVVSLCLASTLVLYQNCGGSLEGQEEEVTTTFGGGPGTNSVPEKVGITAGVNNFESTYSNLKVITGIEDGSCDEAYEEGKSSLPVSNDISTLNAAAQSATVKIAACLCREAISQNRTRNILLPGVDLNGAPSADMIANGLVDRAFGANNSNVAPETKEIIAQTYTTLTSVNGRSQVEGAFGACVATLGSAGTNIL